MKNMVHEIKKDFINKNTIINIVFAFALGIMVYMPIVVGGLTNAYDSLWDETYYYFNNWFLSLGRWAWFIVEKIIQGSYIEPFSSLTSLLIFSIGYIVFLKTISIENRIYEMLLSCIFMVSTVICCMLSYRTFLFALAFLFSSISSYCLIKINDFLSIIISTIFLTLSLGTYQSNIGCFCLTILFYLLIDINKNGYNAKKVLLIIIKAMVVVVVSCLIYKLIWNLFLNIYNVGLADYKNGNAGNITISSIIMNLPYNILQTYRYFLDYYSELFVTTAYPVIIKTLWAVNVLILLINFGYKCFKNIDNYKAVIACVILLVLLPIASNFAILLLDTGIQLQQLLPITMVLPLLTIVNLKSINFCNSFFTSTTKQLLIIIISVFVAGNMLAVNKDIEAMRQGKTATDSLMQNVCSDLISNGFYEKDKKFCFFGLPSENELFHTNEIWNIANNYAKVGNFSLNAWVMPSSYQGTFDKLGINLHCNFSSNEKYNEFIKNGVVDRMTCYPCEGSIIEVDDYVLIKISNTY